MGQVSTAYELGSSGSSVLVDHMVIRKPRAPMARHLPPCSARALAMWPRLDRARLLRTKGDPARIAVLVTPRTVYSTEHVIAMLTRDREPR